MRATDPCTPLWRASSLVVLTLRGNQVAVAANVCPFWRRASQLANHFLNAAPGVSNLSPMARRPVDLAEKFSLFSEHWSPKVVARLNDYEIKVVKVQGEFVWHTHEDTDELFLVTSGELTIRMHDGDVVLGPGQLLVVPRGVEHCPVADGEVQAILMEPSGVINTGDAGGPLTAAHDDSLA
jgi:mannose-6-phosphate isomerase-like protein (cupin superfamily)